jgi:alkylated DNA repair dioxygenase AlkB
MPQLTFFDAADAVLADDERGRVVYTPHFIDAATAAGWFAELRTAVTWRTERRMMYDREVDVPRLMAGFRLDPAPLNAPPAIGEAARCVVDRLQLPFNSVGLNLYRDGRDSVAPHSDHLNEIRAGCPIALLSLGATRRMTIRAKEPPRPLVHVDLEPGSLLVMDYSTQLHYTHGVPKVMAPVGERISLAFRVRRRREEAASEPERGRYR